MWKGVFGLLLTFLLTCCASSEKDDDDMDTIKNTESKNGWSVSRQLLSGDQSNVCSLQADFKQRPGIYTAQFTLSPTDLLPPQPLPGPPTVFYAPLQAEATIEWSVEGNTTTRRISVTNGAAISGPGQAVRIVIKDTSFIPAGFPPGTFVLGQKFFTAITLTPGVRAVGPNPPVLVETNEGIALVSGGSTVVQVPENAGVNSVLVSVGYGGGPNIPFPEQSCLVTQTGAAGVPLATYYVRAYGFAPLFPGATQILLSNFGPNPMVFSVIWGIDG